MRNLIIVIVLIFIFAAGSIVSDAYIKKSADEMLTKLDSVSTREDIENLTNRWKELSSLVELVIDHGEIDILNQHLWAMEIEIDGDEEEFEESRKLAKEMFRHIRDRNTIAWNNVF